MLSLSSAWTDYFDAPGNKLENPKQTADGQYFVLDSQFIKENSGCIIMQTSSSKSFLLVERTSFFNDTRTSHGSCLYFNSQGQCVQNKVCSTSCYITDGYGHHSRVIVSPSNENKSYIHLTTVYQCGKEEIGFGCFYHYYGEQLTSNTNVSKGLSYQYSMGYFISGTKPSFVKFCSFTNCTSSNNYCISLYTNPTLLSFSNILGNNANHCIRSANVGQLTIEDCIIKENKGQYLFSNEGNPNWITVVRCIVENNNYGSYFSSGAVTTNNMKTEKLSLKIFHLSTANCYAEFPYSKDNFTIEPKPNYMMLFIYPCTIIPIMILGS